MDAFGAATSAVLTALGGESAWDVFVKSMIGVVATALTALFAILIKRYCENKDQEPDLEDGESSSSGGSQGREPRSSGENPPGRDNATINGNVYIMFARQIREIVHTEKPGYWKWTICQQNSRFFGQEIVEQIKSFYFFYVEARINFRNLPLSDTEYGVYFIFKTSDGGWRGFDTLLQASVTLFNGDDNINNDDLPQSTVCLKPTKAQPNIGTPMQRSDGWMELELGRFPCDDNTREQEVKVFLTDPRNNRPGITEKDGLIIAGIELRPVR